MAKTTSPQKAVLIDDELHNALWMIDFLQSRGLEVLTAESANDALALVKQEIYRLLVIDLNIPVLPPIDEAVAAKGATNYARFPGLYVAEAARNAGYRDRQVILYSVHREREIADIAERLRITYIMKGRPQEIKKEVEEVLAFDPTA
ncbi:MAG: response regulator [Methylobacteriaceae bacterium]|nr:response regulator [Methylobacteriaceae bacterium]